MSVYTLQTLGCGACGASRTVKMVDSANPIRHPPFLDELLDRRFSRHVCPDCGHVDVVEGPMLWTDVPHGLAAWLQPDAERFTWSDAEMDVRAALTRPLCDEGPGFVRAWGRRASIRIVFGLEELRDKVVAHRAGLDDRVVEALKLPFVDAENARSPVLESVDDHGLYLATAPPADTFDPIGPDRRHVAIVPWSTYERTCGDVGRLADAHPGLFTGTWVHCLRAAFPAHAPAGPVVAERP